MKIGYVYDAVHPWVTGGVEKRVWEIATRLSSDHDVHWYGLKWWDGPEVVEREGVTLHGVTRAPASLYTETEGRRSISEAVTYSSHLVRPLLKADFDVIDCQEFPYFPCFPSKVASAARNTALIVTWHEVWNEYWYEYLGWKGVFGRVVERLVAQLPDAHIAVSERTGRDVASLGGRDPTLVPNGISLDTIEHISPVAENPDVVFVGRLIEEKNVQLLLEALAVLRENGLELHCVIVGDGPERSAVERRTASLKLRDHVEVRGFVDEYQEVLGLLKSADVFAFPSRREGFGITVLEALACGTPVATVDHPRNAATELVRDGETGHISALSPTAFARAISESRELCAQSCMDSVQDYDWDQIADRAEAVYKEVC